MCYSFELEGWGVIEPLSINMICGGDGGVMPKSCASGGRCAHSSYRDSTIGVSRILSPTNFVPTGMKSAIEKKSSPYSLCSFTHHCTSSSEEESSIGLDWVDGVMLVTFFLTSIFVALAC